MAKLPRGVRRSRLTGISTPIGGVEWQPAPREADVASELLLRLEDRRVLYSPDSAEVPHHCVASVMQMRSALNEALVSVNGETALSDNIRALGAACRKFLDRLGDERAPDYNHMSQQGHWRSWQFQDALGQLRGVFGVHIAIIADRYKLETPAQLASLLPANPSEDDLNA